MYLSICDRYKCEVFHIMYLNNFKNNSFENENERASLCCCTFFTWEKPYGIQSGSLSPRPNQLLYITCNEYLFGKSIEFNMWFKAKQHFALCFSCGAHIHRSVSWNNTMIWKWLVWLVTLSDDFSLISFPRCTRYVNLFTVFFLAHWFSHCIRVQLMAKL